MVALALRVLPPTGWLDLYSPGYGNLNFFKSVKILSVVRMDGQPDTCGNPPPTTPPVIAPPDIINQNIMINHNNTNITLPISISPKLQLPGLSIGVLVPILNPSFNLNLNPQFSINPVLNVELKPNLKLDFGLDNVKVKVGLGDTITNNDTDNFINNNNLSNVTNNVSNVLNNTNNISTSITTVTGGVVDILDKLDCEPCLLLDEIKDILTYQPVYTSSAINNIQSVVRDNLLNIGYLEIDITNLPHASKTMYGGNADDILYTGWLTWRMNGYNFERILIHNKKTIYWSPKWANGFSICCTHGARCNTVYYTEIKD